MQKDERGFGKVSADSAHLHELTELIGASLSEPHIVVTAVAVVAVAIVVRARCLSTLRHLTFCARGRGMVWPGYELYTSARSGLGTICTLQSMAQRRQS